MNIIKKTLAAIISIFCFLGTAVGRADEAKQENPQDRRETPVEPNLVGYNTKDGSIILIRNLNMIQQKPATGNVEQARQSPSVGLIDSIIRHEHVSQSDNQLSRLRNVRAELDAKIRKLEQLQPPAVITTNEIVVNPKDVWYGVYTPSTPGGLTSFVATHDGQLISIRVVIHDKTVYQKVLSSDEEFKEVPIDLEGWVLFFNSKVALKPFKLSAQNAK